MHSHRRATDFIHHLCTYQLKTELSKRTLLVRTVPSEPDYLWHCDDIWGSDWCIANYGCCSAVDLIGCLLSNIPKSHGLDFSPEVKIHLFTRWKVFLVIVQRSGVCIDHFYCSQRGNIANYLSVVKRVLWARKTSCPSLFPRPCARHQAQNKC